MAKIPRSELTGSLELIRTTVLVILYWIWLVAAVLILLFLPLLVVQVLLLMVSATTKPDYGSKYQIREYGLSGILKSTDFARFFLNIGGAYLYTV